MADCESCKNYDRTTVCSTCENDSDFEEVAMSNADKIRAMNDEELAEFLDDMCLVKTDFHCEECNNPLNCDVCYLDWLQSEAE